MDARIEVERPVERGGGRLRLGPQHEARPVAHDGVAGVARDPRERERLPARRRRGRIGGRREVAEPERLGRPRPCDERAQPEQDRGQAPEPGSAHQPVRRRSSSAALRPRNQRGSSESATSSTPAAPSSSTMRRTSQVPVTIAPAATV